MKASVLQWLGEYHFCCLVAIICKIMRTESLVRLRMSIPRRILGLCQQLVFCCSFWGWHMSQLLDMSQLLAHVIAIGLHVSPTQSYRYVGLFTLKCLEKVFHVKALTRDRLQRLNLGKQLRKFPILISYFSNICY